MSAALQIRLLLWLWFGAAFAAGHSGWLARMPPTALPGLALVLAAVAFSAARRLPALRTWLDAHDLRALVLLHAVRLVGLFFIPLYLRGELPRAFAVAGVFGETVVALFAVVLAVAPFADERRHRLMLIWSVVGLMDFLLLSITMLRLLGAGAGTFGTFAVLPLSFIPTLLVPLLLASHGVILLRLLRPKPVA